LSEFPDFKLPIDDRWSAEFWLDEWIERFEASGDHAFKEQADAMRKYIDRHFDVEDE
jgi:hypothetical protein